MLRLGLLVLRNGHLSPYESDYPNLAISSAVIMPLKKSILANYASQIYITVIGIFMVPIYIRYMGAEAYGLVGFYVMLQTWFMLLDMGLTPTIARETSRFRGGAVDTLNYRRLVRALEGVFLIVSLIGGAAMFSASSYIANDWLRSSQLPIIEIQTAIELMSVIIALRWMCGLYRGAISGSERFIWLGGYSSIIATIRFIGVLPVFIFIGVTPIIFFTFQFVIAFIEFTGLFFYAYRLLPEIPQGQKLSWDFKPIKSILKFSLTIAFTSSVWVLLTQTDKLVLSKILPLAEYGYFTLAVLVASGVIIISGPVSGALMPRMSKLEAEGDHAGLIRIYRQGTQFISVLAGAASVTLAYCSEPLLSIWTGDEFLAHQASPVLILYALGNGIMAVAAFPYYLQYAKGDLRLHLIGNAMFVGLLIPAIIWASSKYGGIGAGYVWLIMNLVSFAFWLPFVHRKFESGLNLKWYGQDVLIIFLAEAIAGYCFSFLLSQGGSIKMQHTEIIFIGLFVLMVGAAASSEVRVRLKNWLA